MKKILTFILFITVANLTAQVSQKDLQGTWKLVSYKDGQAIIDAVKGTFELVADYKATLTPEELKEEERNYAIMAKQYKVSTLAFKDNTARQIIGEETYTGTFVLTDYEKVTEITITESDGGPDEPAEIAIINKQLVISMDGEFELVYKKQ